MTTRCHSCRSDSGTRVQMTRTYNGLTYRRRVCKCCGSGSYTVEQPIDKMPPEGRRRAGSMNQVRLDRRTGDAD